jgi:hypothetical protein
MTDTRSAALQRHFSYRGIGVINSGKEMFGQEVHALEMVRTCEEDGEKTEQLSDGKK